MTIRYSDQTPSAPICVNTSKTSNQALFRKAGAARTAEEMTGALVFVGSVDSHSLALRRAQALVRYDRLTSYWSHVAMVLKWNAKAPEKSIGLEVTLNPSDSFLQCAGNNGVTPFQLEKYMDAKRYPNICMAPVTMEPEERRAIRQALKQPNRSRSRFPMWDILAPWAQYAYDPDRTPNPLSNGVPMPCGSLVQYAYESANIDIFPGALGNHDCPEVLWATVLRWNQGIKAQFQTYLTIRDEVGTPYKPRKVLY